MGVSIECTNPKYSFDMGCGGFLNLRKNVAKSIDKRFGELYEESMMCLYDKSAAEDLDRKTTEYIESHPDVFPEEDNDVLDFLYTSDCGGKINYRTAKKIADLLEKSFSALDLEHKMFRYAIRSHNDYREFIEFLRDCYSHRKNMVWY